MNPEILMLLVALLALCAYAVFGGADFGAGVWEFNTALRAGRHEKDVLYRAIGPVWEANHVWLIFLLMILWSGFPVAFAAICRLLFIPLLLTLVGIVFRGAAYAFRSSLKQADRQRRIWESVFALASTAAPFFMGTAIGVLAGANPQIDADGRYGGNWLTDWARPESLYFGFFAVGICAFLAAVFLNRETAMLGESELNRIWRRRALVTGVLTGAFAVGGLIVVRIAMPGLWQGLATWGWPLVAGSVVCGIAAIVLVHSRRDTWAAIAAAFAVVAVILGWGLARYPYLVAPNLSVENSAAPKQVLWLLLGCIAGGLVVVLPPLFWLLSLFKSANRAGTTTNRPKSTSN